MAQIETHLPVLVCCLSSTNMQESHQISKKKKSGMHCHAGNQGSSHFPEKRGTEISFELVSY